LLTTLGHKGYLANTLVVITADHGEALGEHGLYAHANSVREEVLQIPLALISYGYQPVPLTIKSGSSQTDISPTILAEFGMTLPLTWTGKPLQQQHELAFSYFMQRLEVGLLDQRDPQNIWKFWVDQKSGGQYAFNLSRDPGENFNVVTAIPESLRNEWVLALLKLPPVNSREQ